MDQLSVKKKLCELFDFHENHSVLCVLRTKLGEIYTLIEKHHKLVFTSNPTSVEVIIHHDYRSYREKFDLPEATLKEHFNSKSFIRHCKTFCKKVRSIYEV